MNDKEYAEFVERCFFLQRITYIVGFGPRIGVALVNKYRTIANIQKALTDNTFSFEGCGVGRVNKLKKEFEVAA